MKKQRVMNLLMKLFPTEGLIKTFKKWREGKAFDKELGDKLNTKQLDNFDDLKYIKQLG